MKARILYTKSDASDSNIKKAHDAGRGKMCTCMPPFNTPPNIMKVFSEISESFDCVGRLVCTKSKEEYTPTPDLNDLAMASAEYASKQTEADAAVGDTVCKYVNTAILRAKLDTLQSKVSETGDDLKSSKSELFNAESERAELARRSCRAAENLRRARLAVAEAIASLETERPIKASELEERKQKLAKAEIKVDRINCQLRDNAELIEFYKQITDNYATDLYRLSEAKADLEDTIRVLELPRFFVVPSNDCIVLMAINYDLYAPEDFVESTKWSMKIGGEFPELTDSERIVMGRLFAIICSLKGDYEVCIDEGLEAVKRIYEHFKNMLK